MRRDRVLRDDRGDISSAVILLPIAIAIFMLVVHAMLVWNAKQVVDAAAQDALHAAQQFGAEDSDGEDAANATLQLSNVLSNVSVDVDKSADQVKVVVSATARTPFFDVGNSVRSELVGPSERFVDEAERAP